MDSAAGGGIGNLSHEQRQELRDVFDTIDQNARGSIPASKLLEVVKALGFERPDETTLDTWMLTVDPDGTGRITYSRLEEFMSLRYDEMNQRQEIMSAFKLFKPDATDVENARITLADLQRISAHLGEHIPDDELREMINIADPNETNSVGFSDFMRMMRKTGLF
ncbi:putative centrin [Coemansia spiralis]|nr:putative centrin [Coemansia spiralis]